VTWPSCFRFRVRPYTEPSLANQAPHSAQKSSPFMEKLHDIVPAIYRRFRDICDTELRARCLPEKHKPAMTRRSTLDARVKIVNNVAAGRRRMAAPEGAVPRFC
jgi:hypothetical protein